MAAILTEVVVFNKDKVLELEVIGRCGGDRFEMSVGGLVVAFAEPGCGVPLMSARKFPPCLGMPYLFGFAKGEVDFIWPGKNPIL